MAARKISISLALMSWAFMCSACDNQTASTTNADQTGHPFIGCWENEDGMAREVWSKDPSGWLFGYAVNRDENNNVKFFEQMRIADGVMTVSGPNDAPVDFAKIESEIGLIFENAKHDYPQRITYIPSPGRLDAEISMLDGTQKVEFKKRAC